VNSATIIRKLTFAIILMVAWLLTTWIGARALIVNADLTRADALVVMAGSATYLERTHHAAQLFKAGRAPRIVLTNDNIRSGWSVEEQRNPLFVELAAGELRRQGIPVESIEIVPGNVTSTYDEACQLRDYTRVRGWRSILVVTSAYQSRRVMWTVRRVFQGRDFVVGMNAVSPGEQSPLPATWWCHAIGWKLVPTEYVKLLYYRMRY